MSKIIQFAPLFLLTILLFADPPNLEEQLDKLEAKPTASLARNVATTAILERQTDTALPRVANTFVTLIGGTGKKRSLPQEKLKELTALADALLLMSHVSQSKDCEALDDKPFCKWLFQNQARLDSFLDYFAPQADDFTGAVTILRQLYRHDVENRNQTWPLMLSLALVWDKMPQQLHHQTGPNTLAFTEDIENRYDYFKKVLTAPGAPFTLDKLSHLALCLIVETPVPVSELLWAQKNVRERNPDKLYKGIKYDNARLNANQFDWPNGPYTLQAIKSKGGICTDQAYFTVMVLRSRGIPSLMFSGKGLMGRHAWVAYLKNKRTWETDVGRYQNQDFTTGETRNPQTGETFNDHLLPIICESAAKQTDEGDKDAEALARLAVVLLGLKEKKLSMEAARLAIASQKTNMLAWNILLNNQDKPDGKIEIYDEQAKLFTKYPDAVLNIRMKQAKILHDNGKNADADALLKKLLLSYKKREDLTREIAMLQIELAMEDNNPAKARQHFEQYLKNQKKEGAKVLEDLFLYLSFTKETNQTGPAVDFTEDFVRTFKRSFKKYSKDNPLVNNWDKEALRTAYENNKDYNKLKKLKK